MDSVEQVDFIATNWLTVVKVVAVVGPILAALLGFLYKNRIDEADASKRRLQAELEESRKKLEAAAEHAGARSAAADHAPSGAATPGAARPVADTGILAAWPKTNDASQENLLDLLRDAKKKITIFGLTRNFYVSDEVRSLILARSQEIPVVFFLMDPDCASRADRYRIEPIEASLEDPERFLREVGRPFGEMLRSTRRTEAGSNLPGLAVYYFNFPCSFAVEEIDDHLRVMLYGHGKRGTEGPILLLHAGGPLASYFETQLRWLEKLATQGAHPPWREKGIAVTPVEDFETP
ncbi:MAG: hypothetical protein JXB46_06225 [Candidatus Eisenbacteria bacterium]|nr:hypothetical protein [Candidatus Eisenbacteria bacterium]